MSLLAYLVSILGIACSLVLFVAKSEPGWLVSGIAIAVVLAAFSSIARRLDRIERKLGGTREKGPKFRKSRKTAAKADLPAEDDLENTIEELDQRRSMGRPFMIGARLGAWQQEPRDKASA
jgi:hypothetical protein